MTAADKLGLYAKGWTEGEVGTIVQSLADDYVMDDPHSGRITKAAFAAYFKGFKDQMDAVRERSRPFMEVSDLMTQDVDGVLNAWVWWAIPGTPVQGSGLIKVTDQGVVSERLAFYTKLPE